MTAGCLPVVAVYALEPLVLLQVPLQGAAGRCLWQAYRVTPDDDGDCDDCVYAE